MRGLLRGGAEDGQLFGVSGLSEVCRRGEAYFDIQNMLSVEQDLVMVGGLGGLGFGWTDLLCPSTVGN